MSRMALAPVTALFVVLPFDVLAYIDPISGSMAIQALIAVVAGALVAFRQKVAWVKAKILTLFRRKDGAPPKKSAMEKNGDVPARPDSRQ